MNKQGAIDKQAFLKIKTAMNVKVAAMTHKQIDARVEEIYAIPKADLTDKVCLELFTIMFGDTPGCLDHHTADSPDPSPSGNPR